MLNGKDVVIILNYDYDNELGYSENVLIVDPNQVRKVNGRLVVDLYVEDIRDLLEGTGMKLDD